VKWISQRRPSPALVIAVIALFVSLSGVSYGVATGFIDSREIKNNEVRSIDLRNNEVRSIDLRNNQVRGIDIRNSTVRGQDVALNTLGGNDINEDSLGKVPSAASADTATTAGSATTANSVGGVSHREVEYLAQTGGDYSDVLNIGGLRLEGRCLSAGTPALELRATPAAQNSDLVTDVPTGFPDLNDNDFDAQAFVYDGTNDGLLRIEYAGSDGSVVSVQGFIRLENNGVRGTTNDCGVFGVAQAG
jgi:hypothetical protein